MQDKLSLLRKKLYSEFTDIMATNIGVKEKADRTLVTKVDLAFSDLVKKWGAEHFPNHGFYCEEDIGEFTYPMIILDPIDGTNELVNSIPECVLSLAIMNSASLDDPKNIAMIYNPFTGYEVNSFTPFFNKEVFTKKYLAFVSRFEFSKNLFKDIDNTEIDIIPKGSIAYKLGLLSSHICDLVFSLNPKNVWDIAAGTILATQRGYEFYENNKKIDKLEKLKYDNTLLWVHKSMATHILDTLK